MPLGAWLHDLSPYVFELSPGLGLRWYGLSYLAGFLIAWWIFKRLARIGFTRVPPERVGDVMLAMILGVVVGGRLGYVLLYDPSLLVRFEPEFPWWGLLALNHGGMASHGGIIGVVLAAAWVARSLPAADGSRAARVPLLHLLDVLALLAPFGLFLGRLANFVNGELLGRVVAPPGQPAPWWAVRFPHELRGDHAPALTPEQMIRLDELLRPFDPAGVGASPIAVERMLRALQRGQQGLADQVAPLVSARHPSQLYQALAEGVVLGAVVWLLARRPRLPGVIGCGFIITYGVLRVLTEVWRLPDAHLAVQRPLGLSRGQWFSLAMVAAGFVASALIRRRGGERMGGWARRSAAPLP